MNRLRNPILHPVSFHPFGAASEASTVIPKKQLRPRMRKRCRVTARPSFSLVPESMSFFGKSVINYRNIIFFVPLIMTVKTLLLTPIGTIATPFLSKYGAPRQPASAAQQNIGIITLNAHHNFEQALEDLKEFDYIWILFWFDRNANWKPKVLPPNSGRVKRGLFATRAPYRPNPIGLSLCRLIDIRGRRIRIENPDMLDGTPILDIKPYIPHAEAFPDARSGWIGEVNEQCTPSYRLLFSPAVERKFKEIGTKESRDVRTYLTSILSRDPYPHAYRRIKTMKDGTSVIAVRRWRFTFEIDGKNIRVTESFRGKQTIKNTHTQ